MVAKEATKLRKRCDERDDARCCQAPASKSLFGCAVVGLMALAPIETIAGGDYAGALSKECEIALARSALPVRLRDKAIVYVWEGANYSSPELIQGGFHCFVARNHPYAVIPMCVSESGSDSILLGEMYKSELVMNGMSNRDAIASFEEKSNRGEFKAPTEPGVNYMMSSHNKIFTQANGNFWGVPAHVMMFAPHANPAIVGSATINEAITNPGIPVVTDSGIHSYIVTFVDQASSSEEVFDACDVAEINGDTAKDTVLD